MDAPVSCARVEHSQQQRGSSRLLVCSPLLPPPCQCAAVLAANLLCRLPDPQRFLARLPSLIKPGGVSGHGCWPGIHALLGGWGCSLLVAGPAACCVFFWLCISSQLCAAPWFGLPARPLLLPPQVLVLVSPYSWLPAWTPQEKWVGGFRDQVSRHSGGLARGSGLDQGTGI